MFEFLTRGFVLIGYLAVALNSYLILRRCACSRYRKISLHAIGIAASFWAGFYLALEIVGSGFPMWAPPTSRIFHTVTIGAFIVQQFMIQSESQHNKATLEDVLRSALSEEG